jgi:hypothetical protein
MEFLIFTFHKLSVVTNAEGKVNAYMTTKFCTVNWSVVRQKQLFCALLMGYTVLTWNAATQEVVRLLKTINSGNCEEREWTKY